MHEKHILYIISRSSSCLYYSYESERNSLQNVLLSCIFDCIGLWHLNDSQTNEKLNKI